MKQPRETAATEGINVNGRSYRLPAQPVVIVCVDGLDPAYLDAAFAVGAAPFLEALDKRGWRHEARSAMPSFTNPNNVSIVTGVAPAAHGIAGNYFYDPASGSEVMMDDPRFLRVGTIPAALAAKGARIAIVTAKDKLRRLLGHGLPGSESALCISIERPSPAAQGFVPAETPDIYSAAASEAVFAAGLALLERWEPDLLYLSTTDYIQHKHAPGEATANDFVATIDRYLQAMDTRGARLVITADHGMRAKTAPDGTPNIVFLAEIFDRALPEAEARIVLPITDPYVRHHGALGAFATIYLGGTRYLEAARAAIAGLPGIEAVLTRDEAAVSLELPADRIGDLCVLARADTVLGTRRADHDLSGLDRPLRSHGGAQEQTVPFILNFALGTGLAGKPLRNFDAFAAALNDRGGPAMDADRCARSVP
jgi:phosphonoacetate hydrolase